MKEIYEYCAELTELRGLEITPFSHYHNKIKSIATKCFFFLLFHSSTVTGTLHTLISVKAVDLKYRPYENIDYIKVCSIDIYIYIRIYIQLIPLFHHLTPNNG